MSETRVSKGRVVLAGGSGFLGRALAGEFGRAGYEPVVLTRKAGKWSADPQGVLFAAQKASHKHCQVTYRAFASRAAFDSHVKKHADLFEKDVKPLTLAQMIELTKPKTEKK